ncbi:MAG: AGE family epimerase/isomerase [Rhabdaerophilum sp.]
MPNNRTPASQNAASLDQRSPARVGRGRSAVARDLRDWMERRALPFWIKKGWDADRGGFYERFSLQGEPDREANRRIRVQWRQIYVLAHASVLGWGDGLKLAFKGLEYVLAQGWAPDGQPGFAHVLHADGTVASSKRDSYDHAFALLALAWLARASDDSQVRTLLELVLDFVQNDLTDGNGFLLEALPPELPRRQNPHMHMFESALALHEALGHSKALPMAQHYRRMLEKVFLDRKASLLLEFFDDDWSPQLDDGAALVEPGHMAEWVWLIRKHERLAGLKASPIGTHLLGAALQAAEPVRGFLIDEIDTLGRARKTSRRLWPQTELIKAWLAQAENGADRADGAAEELISNLMQTYLSGPFAGGWYDQFTAEGKPVGEFVPASTLYHLFVAVVEADRVIG